MSEETRDPKPVSKITSPSELSESELDGAVGGATNQPATIKPTTGKAFEINDYSFGVENP